MTILKPSRLLALMTVSLFVATACAATRTQKSAGEGIDDALITAQVKTALIGDATTKARHIDVEVFKGRVQLNGFVGSERERTQAVSLARKVNGVHNVDNNLKVKGEPLSAGEVVDDSSISAKVKSALIADERTKAHQINVETHDSVVLLAGFVANSESRSAAGEVASSVTGVKSVDNQIAIK
jgi:hyperosmotically inducible periplasmic protein